MNRARKTAASSTVTGPALGAAPSRRGQCARSASGRSLTNVSSWPDTSVICSPVMYWVRSTMCAPMSPSAPEPALALSSRQDSGAAGSAIQSWRYCARTCRTSPIRPSATSLPGQRDRRHPAVGEPDHRDARRAAAAASAAAAIASASATVLASGFSHSTCLPAASAAIAISAWVSPGVQMSTRSTSAALDQRRASRSRVSAQPSRPAASAVRSASRPQSDPHAGVQREVEEARRGAPGLGVGGAHEGVADHAHRERGSGAGHGHVPFRDGVEVLDRLRWYRWAGLVRPARRVSRTRSGLERSVEVLVDVVRGHDRRVELHRARHLDLDQVAQRLRPGPAGGPA